MNIQYIPLHSQLSRVDFTCGELALDIYLQKFARQDISKGYATVIAAVEAENPTKIIGYYTLSPSSLNLGDLPQKIAQKLPKYPHIPTIHLGRLAVHSNWQNMRIGTFLFANAIHRAYKNELNWAFFTVDAKNDRAVDFYHKFGFTSFIASPYSLWIERKTIERIINQSYITH